jgi:hypothetical protein
LFSWSTNLPQQSKYYNRKDADEVSGIFFSVKSFTPYYVWPSIDPTYDVVHFLSTDESIQCQGYTFYRLDLGPRYANSTQDSEDELEVIDAYMAYCLVFIVMFVWYCHVSLRQGHFNKLKGFVSFESKEHSPLLPVKYSVAFTIFCNFSRDMNTVL